VLFVEESMAPRLAQHPLAEAERDPFDDAPTMVRPTRTSRLEGLIDDALLELDFDESAERDDLRKR